MKNLDCFFGKIVQTLHATSVQMNISEMQLSKTGKIAQKYWNEIP